MDELKDQKAKAYDLFATIEACQAELRKVNQKIAELMRASIATPASTDSPVAGDKSGSTDA